MNRRELEARKRALVAESEAYRETLRLELNQLQLHAAHVKQRMRLVALAPAGLALLPVIIRFIRRRSSRDKPRSWAARLFTSAVAGWRLARRFSPVISAFRERVRRRKFAAQHERVEPS
jgi:hypothetical protein